MRITDQNTVLPPYCMLAKFCLIQFTKKKEAFFCQFCNLKEYS